MTRLLTVLLVSFLTLLTEPSPDGAGAQERGPSIATREWLEATGTGGTIRLYGTPAEEGGSGKVYLVREGYFDDVDAVLHWHAGDGNSASPSTSLANESGKFCFRGISAHAAAAPDRGRSALDGVEAMNYMVNLMREHVPQETRIHYVITNGGSAPNVIPDFAEVFNNPATRTPRRFNRFSTGSWRTRRRPPGAWKPRWSTRSFTPLQSPSQRDPPAGHEGEPEPGGRRAV